jgi:hypothetical protein
MIVPAWLAEVGDLRLPGRGDQDVLRLDVAVHHPEPVRLGEPGEHLLHDGERRGHAEGAAGAQHVAQRAAVDQLHDEEQPVLIGALVVDVDHGGVVDAGRRARLPLEADAERRITREPRVHDLDGDRPVEPGVHAAVDDGHAARRDGTPDAVTGVEQRTGDRGSVHAPTVPLR